MYYLKIQDEEVIEYDNLFKCYVKIASLMKENTDFVMQNKPFYDSKKELKKKVKEKMSLKALAVKLDISYTYLIELFGKVEMPSHIRAKILEIIK